MSNTIAIKDLLFKMADSQLIMGHRYSEWIGIGPVIEEDIAFGSLAQDKTGHAFHLYQLLSKMGESSPDQLAFYRTEKEFKSAQLVELSDDGDYANALVRHFYFDHEEAIRFDELGKSSYKELAGLANKFFSEVKYHTFHADTWIKQLLNGTEESRARIITSLTNLLPYALGLFEPGKYEEDLLENISFCGEVELKNRWVEKIKSILATVDVTLNFDVEPINGGRHGYHSELLAPLLAEMCEVTDLESDDTAW